MGFWTSMERPFNRERADFTINGAGKTEYPLAKERS